jgi:hypothetical protein
MRLSKTTEIDLLDRAQHRPHEMIFRERLTQRRRHQQHPPTLTTDALASHPQKSLKPPGTAPNNCASHPTKGAVMTNATHAPDTEQGTAVKDYYVQFNIGQARYVVNFHDGVKTHGDGSPFYDIRIAKNKRDLNAIIAELQRSGYVERGAAG